tara:strand:+ start:429 stop:2039 length:1611 start_codon:yes stop_codon:yes gene_type:complete
MQKLFIKIFAIIKKNPLYLYHRLIIRIKKIISEIVLSNKYHPYILHNNKYWKKNIESSNGNVILCDTFDPPEYILSTNYFIQNLAETYNSKILTFSSDKKTNFKTIRKSLNFSYHIQTKIKSNEIILKKIKIINNAKKNIKSKYDVYNFYIDDIWIGIDIYETYLKNGRPTVDIADPFFWNVFSDAVELVLFWQNYFNTNNVKAVFLSHDCYTYYNSIAKVAYLKKVPVYMISAYNFQIATEPFSLYKDRFVNYRKMFHKLSENEKKTAISISKNQIDKRLSGEIGINMNYSEKSAFHKNKIQKLEIKQSERIKIVICTHCFFDNPHGYGEMIFHDFYDWLVFLGNISNKTNYEWYIKVHPDYLPGTIETLNEIIRDFPKFNILPSNVSFHQLSENNIDFALTCFGSIGHELPLLGIQVINCGPNPHMAYDFNWSAKNKKEYEYYLLNLPSLDKSIQSEEIYEFYYMHYYYTNVDNLFYESYSDYLDFIKKNGNYDVSGYKYFLNEFDDDKHQKLKSISSDFINSNKYHYFLKGPE